MARVQPPGRGEVVLRTGLQAQPFVAASTRLVDRVREQSSCHTSSARGGRPRPDRLRNCLSRPASRGRAARYPVALQLQVQAEGLVIALASWIIAIPLSIPVSVMLGKAFSRIMMPLPVRYLPEPGGVVLWLAVAVAVSALASALPARRAMRVTTAAALAYE